MSEQRSSGHPAHLPSLISLIICIKNCGLVLKANSERLSSACAGAQADCVSTGCISFNTFSLSTTESINGKSLNTFVFLKGQNVKRFRISLYKFKLSFLLF